MYSADDLWSLTVLSSPKVISMMKNRTDQKEEPAIAAMASGYTMNTSPGPGAKKQKHITERKKER